MTLEKLLDYFRLGPKGVRRFEEFLKQCSDCEYSNYRSRCYGIPSCEYTKVNRGSIASGSILVCPEFKIADISKYFTSSPSRKGNSSGSGSRSGGDDIPDYDNYTSGHIGPTGGRM